MSRFITNGELRIEAERLCDENEELRVLCDEAIANLRNRETVLELVGMPVSDAQAEATRRIIDRARELGIEVDA